MRHTRRWLMMGGAALAVMAVTGLAWGALGTGPTVPGPSSPGYPSGPGRTSQPVSITVMGIHATNQPKESIDPILLPIADELRRLKFNSFALVVNDTRSVAMTSTWEVPLTEGYALQIQPLRQTDDKAALILNWIRYERVGDKIQAKALGRTMFEIRKGKYLLQGGWRLKEGVLMTAIAVK